MSVVGWDLKAVKKTNGLAGSCGLLDRLMDGIARYGHFAFLLYGLILWFVPGKTRARRRESCLMALFSICLCSLASLIIGRLWKRKRPFVKAGEIWNFTGHKANSSFPSNHAMNGAAVAFRLLRDGMPGAKGMAALSGLLAFSRLFAGIHYPTDLFGGAAIAAVMDCLLNRPAIRRLARRGVRLVDAGEDFFVRWRKG